MQELVQSGIKQLQVLKVSLCAVLEFWDWTGIGIKSEIAMELGRWRDYASGYAMTGQEEEEHFWPHAEEVRTLMKSWKYGIAFVDMEEA